MKNIQILLFLLLILILISCQKKSNKLDYKVFQYKKTDSQNVHISKIVKFNKYGFINYEKFNNYFENGIFRKSNVENKFYYNDTLLTKKTTNYLDRYDVDSSRVEYFYDDKNFLIKRISYVRLRPFKQGSPDGCLVQNSDFESHYIWKTTNIEGFKFNKTSDIYFPQYSNSQNRIEKKYDKKGRVIKEITYNENLIIQEKFYEYIENGYNITSKGGWNGFEKFRFIKDGKGNILEEKMEWKGIQRYRIEKRYDDLNRLISEKRFDEKNELELTYNYIYD